jgi:subtilisin family serine protease
MTIARRALATVALSAAASCTAGLFALTGTAHAASAAQGSVREANAAGAITDHYIIVTKNGADPDTLAGAVGGHVNTRYTTAVNGFAATMSETAAKRLAANPDVSYVEQDRTVTIESTTQTNPPNWGLDRIDQPTLPLDHTYTTGSAASVHAYIIDTGVRMTQTQYAGRVTSGYDFVDHDSDASDCQGHGTHVAGTVGGSTYGVAKDIHLVAVRVLNCQGAGTYSQIIAGVDWVTKNAVKPAVANMSLGGAAGTTLDNAVQKSIDSGVTYVVAGGNDSRDACTKSPARLTAAITVGATDSSDRQASFSNYGKCLDLYAPGVNILSSSNNSDTATMRMSGTSQATPHVTGAAALYLNNHPTATPQQVRDAIINTATTGAVKNAPTTSPNKLLNITTLTT